MVLNVYLFEFYRHILMKIFLLLLLEELEVWIYIHREVRMLCSL